MNLSDKPVPNVNVVIGNQKIKTDENTKYLLAFLYALIPAFICCILAINYIHYLENFIMISGSNDWVGYDFFALPFIFFVECVETFMHVINILSVNPNQFISM